MVEVHCWKFSDVNKAALDSLIQLSHKDDKEPNRFRDYFTKEDKTVLEQETIIAVNYEETREELTQDLFNSINYTYLEENLEINNELIKKCFEKPEIFIYLTKILNEQQFYDLNQEFISLNEDKYFEMYIDNFILLILKREYSRYVDSIIINLYSNFKYKFLDYFLEKWLTLENSDDSFKNFIANINDSDIIFDCILNFKTLCLGKHFSTCVQLLKASSDYNISKVITLLSKYSEMNVKCKHFSKFLLYLLQNNANCKKYYNTLEKIVLENCSPFKMSLIHALNKLKSF